MVYGRYNELVNGVYKPTYNWGASSCMNIYELNLMRRRISNGDLRPEFVKKPPVNSQFANWNMAHVFR